MKILFEEEQKMRQWWVWLVLIAIAIIPVYGIIQQVVLRVPFGDKPTSTWVLLIILVIPLGLIYFFYKLKLKTKITDEAIHINYSILANKKVNWNDVSHAEIIKYSFVGYGLRFSRKYGTVYNTSGNKGLLIKTKFGKFVLGTQKPEALLKAIGHKLLSHEHPEKANTTQS